MDKTTRIETHTCRAHCRQQEDAASKPQDDVISATRRANVYLRSALHDTGAITDLPPPASRNGAGRGTSATDAQRGGVAMTKAAGTGEGQELGRIREPA